MLRKIVVSGYGEASAKPNIAEVGLNITFIQPEANQAQELVAGVTQKLLAELLSLGIPNKDIETRNYSLFPHYQWEKNSRVFKGYQASNALLVKTGDLSLATQIIDAAVKAGVKNIDYVNFTYEDKTALEKEALTKAAQNAVERAKAIAAGPGLKVGPVISVSGNRRSYDSGYYILRESSSYQAERPENVIPPDKIKVTAEVEAVLELVDNYPDK
ncbi:hypothetical protein MHLNE_13670 [Moorella humiferrea]|uniref:SIMPL domain-containing protein n=1 Tax=Neomoorella humiferrea TaxID=676965 RepID=UPI0030D26642